MRSVNLWALKFIIWSSSINSKNKIRRCLYNWIIWYVTYKITHNLSVEHLFNTLQIQGYSPVWKQSWRGALLEHEGIKNSNWLVQNRMFFGEIVKYSTFYYRNWNGFLFWHLFNLIDQWNFSFIQMQSLTSFSQLISYKDITAIFKNRLPTEYKNNTVICRTP